MLLEQMLLLRLSEVNLATLHLHRTHAANGLLALDALFLACLEHFLVFYAQLAALDIKSVERGDDSISIGGLTEVRERKTTEGPLRVEVVIKRVGSGYGQRSLATQGQCIGTESQASTGSFGTSVSNAE